MNAARARLRRAGRGTAPDGAVVTWSVAEGRRGRRWREAVVVDGSIRSSLLLEVHPDGRFAHLELSTAAGLLTLHPESDGTLHGNAIGADGIRHVVAIPWQPDDLLLVAGSPVSRAAAPRRVDAPRTGVAIGIVVGLDLTLGRRAIGRTERGAAVDADGLPALADGVVWPLEVGD